MYKPDIRLAIYPYTPDFDYYTATVDVLRKEEKAVNDYKNGKKGAFNYLYGKVDKIQWGECFFNSKPLTIGHKIHSNDIKKLIEYIIERETK